MNVKLEYLYSEGNWRYNRVLVDGEQVGFVAVNNKLGRLGRTMHHKDAYPNLEIYQALAEKLTKKRKKEFTF